jgi:hypothetical protein
VREDGAWKIDEYHRIEADPVDSNAATPTAAPDAVWPFGAGGAGDFTIPEGPDPLRIRLAHVQLPSGASLTIPPSAEAGIVIAQGTASMSDPAQDGTWQTFPVGSGASLAASASTTIANYGEEPVVLSVLAIGTGQAFISAENGAEIVMLVDVEIDSLPAGPAYYSYEGRMAVPEVTVIEDTSRDGVALLVVDSGRFAMARDGGTWQMGTVGLAGASDPIPAEAFPASGQIELSAGSFALITSGAAFHGTAANGQEARFFLLTIEVNSAVVQQAETRVAESTASPAGEPESSEGTPTPETD